MVYFPIALIWRATAMSIRMGIIGFGYMGHWHLKNAPRVEGVSVVAALAYLASADWYIWHLQQIACLR